MFLHRFLLDSGDLNVNHRNDNKLDNRRDNLRACSTANYTHNQKPKEMHRGKPVTCRLKGVCWDRSKGKYMAQIRPGGRQTFLGYFADPSKRPTPTIEPRESISANLPVETSPIARPRAPSGEWKPGKSTCNWDAGAKPRPARFSPPRRTRKPLITGYFRLDSR